MNKKKIVLISMVLVASFVISCAPAAEPEPAHEPIVEELISILKVNPELTEALKESIRKAERLDAPTLTAYYDFLDKMVTIIPTDRNLLPMCLEFYYLIDNSPDNKLQEDPIFQQWVHKFIKDWGSFLDTTESAKYLETFYTDPIYNIDDYDAGPSGWLTFNQFFSRHVKPGKRPIDGLCDDSVIVSPADSVFQGQWKIEEDSEITSKDFKWSVIELLDNSPYQDRFKGGIFIHSYLSAHDYHRYHVPVRGVVREIRTISGKVVLDVIKKEDGSLDMVDGTGYQFTQARGLIVIDSPVGLVAVLPIGMGEVSSVNLTAQVGAMLAKGEEFGYFAFGGSDIVVMFEADRVKITAEIGTHYNQGETIATAVK
ncbi:MAG: phosphatidylserine decarboxylase [Dehalococcoidia bacterium]|nr:MAG: phosphatidylserine decarboxylase [Dehalococcoidia bacterium]